MNNKLEMLAAEYNAAKMIADMATAHATEVLNEYVEIVFEQAMVEAFNELTPNEQMALIVALLCEKVEDNIAEELTAVVDAIEKAAQEEEIRRYEEERKREFAKLTGIQKNGRVYRSPEPTFLEIGLPEDVLKHLKRLGVNF